MSQNDPLGLFEADNNDPLGLFSAEDAKPKKESLTDKAKKALGWNTGLALALPDAVQRDASIEPEVDQAKLMARRARREDVPEMTAESLGRDALSGALQIGPTAVKGVADIGRFLTGDRVGKDLSTQMDTGIKAIQNTIGSERGQAQRRNFEADMRDENVSAGELLGQNPGALADQVLPTVGSMFLPVGAGAAAGKVATMGSAVKGLSKAEVAARVAKAQEAAGIGTTAAQNAADTFSDLLEKGVSMEDAYKGAAITVPFTVIAGKLTGGGAETALTRAMTGTGAMKKGVVATAKAAGKEGAQETGEEIGQITGEAVGTGEAPTLNQAAKRMAVAGTLGAVVGGGANVAGTAPEMFQSQNTRALQELNDLVEGGEFSDAAPVAAARMTPAGSNHVLVAGMSIDRMSDAMLRRALNVVDDDERRLAIAGELKRRESVKTGDRTPQPTGDNQGATLADQILALEGNSNAAEVDATGNQGQRSDGVGSYGNLQPMPGLDGRGGLDAGTPVAGGGANQSVGSPGGNNGAVGASVVDQSQLLNDVNGVTNAAVAEQVATQEAQANDAQVGAKQAAAPRLTVPQQPTTTKPLEQTPVAMPIPKEIATRTATKTDAELALMAKTNSDPVVQEAVKQEQAKRKPKKDRKAVYPESDSALVAIAKLGGMDTQQLLTNGFDQSDISVQKGAKVSKKTGQLGKAPFRAKQVGFNMPIHRNGGMSFDGMREALVQYGYLPEDASVNDAIELLRRELRGEPVYTASAVQAQAEAAEADRQAMMEAEQEANEASGYDELQGTAEERAADALIEELYGEEVAALARVMRVAGLTEEEINAEIEAFNQRTGAQDGAGQSQERSGEGRAEESGTDAEVFGGKESAEPDWLKEDFGLEGQTNEEAAAEYNQQQAPEEISKEQIDREVDGFGLQQQSQPKPQGVQGDLVTADGRAAKDATVNTENVAKSEVAKPATKIADFGEKIGGAKKDVWTSHKDKLDDAAKLDIKVEPLSKSWPEPNYQSLIDAGADPFVVAFMRASRDAIPRKPTAKWKLKSWAGSVELLRDTSAKLLSGEIDANRAKELLQKAGDVSSNMRKIAGRIELYQLVGHRQSLDGVSLEFHHYTLYKGQENVSIWSIEKEAKATAFSNWPAEIVTGKTKAEVLEKFKEMYDKIDLNKKADRTVSFDLYSQGNKFYVGKKMGRNITQLAGPFDTVKEARAYRTDNQEELIARLEKAKEIPAVRRDTNNPRVGEDMRGGQDVTPELFAETFGFKGVEFGNWVEQKKRQKDLNDSFDALMDMAAIIGVPPKALSLNGELGLAFGARGSGGVDPAAAHYEPGKVVINLTKKEGAGSLGHEWWHALDNYFSRLRGKGGEFTTQALDVSLADRESQFIANTPVRKEMIEAFGAVMRAIRMTALKARSSKLDAKRSKEYWTGKEEMSARAFESYLISKLQDQNASNDYLANIVDQDTWKAAESLGFELDDSYPYPTAGEMPLIREAFDRFFDTVQTKETEQGVAFFSPASPSDAVKNTLLKQAEEAPDPVTTETEWNSLFPNRRIDTPIETLRMGANQFYKLIGNQRSRFSGMVFPTLDRPLFVFEDTDGSHVYVKSFTEGNGVKTFISVAAHIDGTFTVISNGIRGTNSIADRVVSARESGRLLHTAYAADAPNRSATTESEAQPSHAGGLDLNIADDGSEFNDLSEVKQYAVRQAIDRAIAIEQGLDVEPIRRESALLKLRRLRRQLDEGKITEGQFIFDVNMLHQSLENASAAKKFAPVKERARGADYIRQKLLEAKRRGDISEETADMTEWFVLQNPALVDDLGISIRTASDAEQGSRGRYMPATRVMRLFKENAATETGVHEILHHLERMMPEEMRAAIRKEYAKRLADAYKLATKNGNKDIIRFIDLVNEFAVSSKAKTADEALKLITSGKVPYQFYQLFNTSEFWAVNGAELMSNRFAAKDSVFGKIRQWFKEFVQKAKSILGMTSDAAIIRAMDGLLVGDGEFVSKDMLAMTDKFFAVGGQQNTPAPLPEETKAQAAQRKIQDKFNRFTVIKDWLKSQGVQLSEQADVYKAEERMHSRFANKVEDFRTKLVEPLIKKIQAAGFSMDDVSLFLHAQHAEERNNQIAKINPKVTDGSGMSTADANKVLAAAPSELKALANEFRQITEMTKQTLLDAGIISQDMVDAWEGAYSNYVPLKGGPDEKAKSGTGKGLHVNGKMKRALGHGKREGGEWIAENILADYERAVMLAEKNRVGHHLVKMALEAGRDDLITLNKPEKRAVLRNDHAYEVRKNGAVIGVFNTQDAARMFKTMNGGTGITITKTNDPSVIYSASPMLQDNEANVYVNGHAIRVQINDELLAQAYKNLGAEPLNVIFSAGRMLNGYLSKAYTGYNPEFILTNIVRDFTTGLINITGEEGALFAAKAAKNYVSSFGSLLKYAVSGKETQWIKDYRDDGGNTGAAYLSDLERLGKEIKTEYDSYKGVIENLKARDGAGAARAAGRNLFNVSLKWIEHLNQAGENAMRLSIYRAAIESGKTRAEAASLAKNSTVNFNRKGELGANINALYLFFNAGVQGTSALAHAHFKGKHKYQAWALSSGMIGLGFLAAAAFGGGDEDDYDRELSDYDKSRNLVIRAGDSWVKIPVPYGYGFFYNLGRHLADAERKGEWNKMPWHLASDFVGEFTPFSGVVAGKEPDMKQAIFALPTVAQIPGALMVNRTGMGSPIFPENKFDENQPDHLKMWRNTKGTLADDLAQVLDKAGLQVSPETLKYLGRTATGGSGAFVGSVFDAGKLTLEGADLETKEMPFVRKFVKEGSVSDYRSAFYEAKSEASKAADDFARAKKMGDMMSAKKLMEDNRELIAMDKYADRLSKMIKAKRDMQDVVKQDEKLTVAEKRLKLKALELEEQKVYDRYLDIFKKRTQERRERLEAVN